LLNKWWISNIKRDATLAVPHIREYLRRWEHLDGVQLIEENEDSIVWNLTSNGEYSSASAYEAQFFGATLTCFNKLVWKNWAPPKVKFFAWLAIRNRLWTAGRLEKKRMGKLQPLSTLQANSKNSGAPLLSLSLLQEAMGLD
jgi:hypothetical protein